MPKFTQKKYSEYYGSKEYRKNWENTFGKNNEKEKKTHYDICNTNHGGECDCKLIKNSNPKAKEKCSNCHFSIKESIYPGKLICAFNGSNCPKDYSCENYRHKK